MASLTLVDLYSVTLLLTDRKFPLGPRFLMHPL